MIDDRTMIGTKFGLLTVTSVRRDKNKLIKCLCTCDCGKEKEVFYSNLKAGRTKSYGHLEKENREKFKDIKGEVFSDLTVVRKTSSRKDGLVLWECQCSCGRKVIINRKQLLRGYVKDCGFHEMDELVEKQFGELTVTSYSVNKKKVFCKCSCGNEIWAAKSNVLNGHTKSCGHLQLSDRLPRIDGVAFSLFNMKIPKGNTSGYKGVSKRKNGKWLAYITFRGKRITLGEFENIKDAVVARKNAETKYFQPYLKKEKLS